MAGIYTKLDSQVDLHGFADADGDAKTESSSAKLPVEESNKPDAAAHDEKSSIHIRSALLFWKLEISSIVLGGSVVAVIATLLRVYNDQALSEWRAPLSINTVVAILTALLKGALAVPISGGAYGLGHIKWLHFLKEDRSLADMDKYDQASRGAWGSAILVFNKFCGRSVPFVASFGAALAVFSLAIDPFSQASVSITTCVRSLPNLAYIPRVNHVRDTTMGPIDDLAARAISPNAQSAIYAGIYSPPANSSVITDVTCSTGNCTFPVPFTTLDMCHSCSEISDQVVKLDYKTWLLPDYRSTVSPSWNNNLGMHLVHVTTSTSMYEVLGFEKPRTSLSDFQILAVKCQGLYDCSHGIENATHTAIAFECSLTPCVKTYMANMTNHVYAEHEDISKREFLHPGQSYDFPTKSFGLGVNRTFYNGNWIDCHASQKKTDTHTVEICSYKSYTESLHENYTYLEPPLYYRPECTFQVGFHEVFSLYEFTVEMFELQTVYCSEPGHPRGQPWLLKLWDWGRMDISTVDAFAKGLATSIGANWRRNPESLGIEYVEGHTHLIEPCIRAHWGFFCFLEILVAAEFLFFVIIVIISHRSPWRGDWKSSILPYLFQNITLPNLTDKENESDLNKAAEGVMATFEPVDGRWSLTTSRATTAC